jgi:glycosyltransferase involved in cell wall biosynthesis
MSRERTFVVRSCPDLTKIHVRPPQPKLKEGRNHLVVYLGVMGHQDGLDLLLESIAFLANLRKCDDTLFVLIGSGPELPRLKIMASEKGLDALVKFTGRLPDEDVAAYFSTAAFGVAPDRATPMNDKSTMNKILEYMAFGLPVVLYDLTEGRRSADDAALYARNDDPEDFAHKIMTLLDDESLRAQLGARGRKRIEERLNWENEKRTYLQAYEAILED